MRLYSITVLTVLVASSRAVIFGDIEARAGLGLPNPVSSFFQSIFGGNQGRPGPPPPPPPPPGPPRYPGLGGNPFTQFPTGIQNNRYLSELQQLPTIPDVTSLVPELPDTSGVEGSVTVPAIPSLPAVSSFDNIPGLSQAIQSARNHASTALGVANDFVDGIQTAVQQAFDSEDPTGAVRTIVNTILDAYLKVAANCPMIIIGVRVLQEGIRLAREVARSARNVIVP